MNLWHLKSRFYQFARDLPFLKWILDRERSNLAVLVSEMQRPLECALDIGSGAGSTLDLLPPAERLITTDRSLSMLQKAAIKSPASLPVNTDACHLPFSGQAFHLVSCIGVSEYVHDKGRLLHELSRVMKPGGFVLITIAPYNFFNILRTFLGHRLHMARPDRWESLIWEQGFQVVDRRKNLMQNQYLCKK